jgi:1,4-alpha-glucan branching enzyme
VSVQILEERQTALPTQEQSEKSFEPDVKGVTFTIEAPTAKDIYVVGHFNDWKISDESRLARREDGSWEKRMELLPGIYRYQFVVDGEWTLDSKNQERERNLFGTFDSIINIKPSEVRVPRPS